MEFIRLVCLNVETEEDGEKPLTLPGSINDYAIDKYGSRKTNNALLTVWTFRKTLEAGDFCIIDGGLRIAQERLEECHRVIRFFASYLSVVHQIRLTISSPLPTFAIVPTSQDERAALDGCEGIEADRKAFHAEEFTFEFQESPLDLVLDRPDGLESLSEALRLNSALARYREYIRIFEIAFAHAGVGMYKPLLRFLSSGTGGLSKHEVRYWFDELRARAVHADKKEPIFAYEIVKSIERMKLAAYDVVFNKVHWRCADKERRKGLIPISGAGFLTRGRPGLVSAQLFDEFGAFPVNLSACLESTPEDWWSKTRSDKSLRPTPSNGAG